MKRIELVCFSLIIASFFVLVISMDYWAILEGTETQLSGIIADISSAVPGGKVYSEPTLVSGDSGITEFRAIALVLAFAAVMNLFAIALASWRRLRFGPFKLYIPLIVVSAVLIAAISYVAVKSAIFF